LECHIWEWTTGCSDLTNLSTMYIEIIIGISGAILITGLFVRRENNRRKQRGKVLSKTLIKESIVPLRNQTRSFIDLLKNESTTGRPTPPKNLVFTWNQFNDWKIRISPLLAVSGDVINAEHQVLLSKILEDLEMKLDFTYIELDQAHIHGLDKHLTEYLKINKDLVIEVNNEIKSIIQERINKLFERPQSTTRDNLIERFMTRITENEDIIKDIINDKSQKKGQ